MKTLTKAQLAQLDDICIKAFARMDALDSKLYQRGFVTSTKPAWRTPREVQGAGKRWGNPSSTVLSPTPAPLLPAGGAKVGG